jgi:hypothetical protein
LLLRLFRTMRFVMLSSTTTIDINISPSLLS